MHRTIATLLLLSLLAFAPRAADATAQEPDLLLMDGEPVSLNTNPLSPWLQSHPKALPEPGVISSSRWRGYVASWEIRDEQLWLTRVEMELPDRDSDPDPNCGGEPVCFDASTQDVLPQLFPGRSELVAEWYSGALIIPRGELVDYVHMGYGSTYERYLVLVIDDGRVVSRRELDADGFLALRQRRFEAFQRTPAYQAEMDRTARAYPDWSEEDASSFMFEYHAEQYLSVPDAAAR